ncbi:MAG: hypothetical protein K5655_04485 [Lachnospiraceae bacterium]|nr:hypothetical protein [Lachnospiraceae bacterium]
MIIKSKKEAEQLGIQKIDLGNIFNELINWQAQCRDDGYEDSVRFAMINSFEDIVLNSIIEEGDD